MKNSQAGLGSPNSRGLRMQPIASLKNGGELRMESGGMIQSLKNYFGGQKKINDARMKLAEGVPAQPPAPPAPPPPPPNPNATKDNPAGIQFANGGGLSPMNTVGKHGIDTLQTGKGGRVPGTGKGDKIPAKYEPGEYVVSNDMLKARPELRDQLRALRKQVLAAKGMTPQQADAKAMMGTTMKAEDGKTGIDKFVSDVEGAFRPGPVRTPPGVAVDAAINAEKKPPQPGSDLTSKMGAVKGVLDTLNPGRPDNRPSGFDPAPASTAPVATQVSPVVQPKAVAQQSAMNQLAAAGSAVQVAPVSAPVVAQTEPAATAVARNPRYASPIDAAINAEAKTPRQGSDMGSKWDMVKAMGRDAASLFDLKTGTTGTNIAAETAKQVAPPSPIVAGAGRGNASAASMMANPYATTSPTPSAAADQATPVATDSTIATTEAQKRASGQQGVAYNLNDPSSNASILAQNPAGAVRKVGNSYSGSNVTGDVGFVGANGNPISGRPGGGMVSSPAQGQSTGGQAAQALANPDGSQWSASDNAIMAANIRDGIDPTRGTSRGQPGGASIIGGPAIPGGDPNDLLSANHESMRRASIAATRSGNRPEDKAMRAAGADTMTSLNQQFGQAKQDQQSNARTAMTTFAQQAQTDATSRNQAASNQIAQGQLGLNRQKQTQDNALARDKQATELGMEKVKQQLWSAYTTGTPEQKAQAAEQLQMLNGKNAQHDEYATNVVTDTNGVQSVVATNKRTGQVSGQQGQTPLPPGMKKQVGTSNGKPVYEDANGNRFQ